MVDILCHSMNADSLQNTHPKDHEVVGKLKHYLMKKNLNILHSQAAGMHREPQSHLLEFPQNIFYM